MSQSEEDQRFGLDHGVSPIGAKTICVDFDGTIVPWAELFSYPEPFPGVCDAMQRIRAAGYRIVILTSRLSSYWLKAESEDYFKHLDYIKAILDTYEIPFDLITADKQPAMAYIDDRGVRLYPEEWPDIADWIEDGMPEDDDD